MKIFFVLIMAFILLFSGKSNLSASPIDKRDLKINSIYFVNATSLKVRINDDGQLDSNLAGALNYQDQVKIIQIENIKGPFVQIEIISSNSSILPAKKYFVSYQYLASEKNQAYDSLDSGDYFVIQNLATERLRVYQRQCTVDQNCRNHMIAEIEMAIGNDNSGEDTRSVVGYMKIDKWIKFYEDQAGIYPHWYSKNLPMPPEAGSSVTKWKKRKYLTPIGEEKGERSGVRGAFGWFTAKLIPNAHFQWMHGTIGWGADKRKYIHITRDFWANLVMDPRSHGCSRTDNESIAFLHHVLKEGAPVLKVYAIEDLYDKNLTSYQDSTQKWDYILTTSEFKGADLNLVEQSDFDVDEFILEKGSYDIDSTPTVFEYKKQKPWIIFRKMQRLKGDTGNVYNISRQNMKGVFYVDEGLLENYEHPKEKRTYERINKELSSGNNTVWDKLEEEVINVGGLKIKESDNSLRPYFPSFVLKK